MVVNIEQFKGACTCGNEHTMDIRKVLIESGALDKIPAVVKELGLSGKPCILCDDNTYRAAGEKIAQLVGDHALIKLDPTDLHPDEKTVAAINEQLPADTGYIIAVGGGVLTDTGKYIGFTHGGIPVVIVPTAASVDGFAANSSVMTFNHFKHPLTTQAGVAIIADTRVLAAAPYRLTASGLGDLLGKYIALADWKFANIVAGEALCPRIYAMIEEALSDAMRVIDKVKKQDEEAIGALMYALVLSGLTIQMWGNSRPASGAEHHISHLWELNILHPTNDGLHGEMVGVGTLMCKRLYEKIFETVGDHVEDYIRPYDGMPIDMLKKYYGRVFDELMEYNKPDESALVDQKKLVENWAEIRKIYNDMPTSQEMYEIFKRCGMKYTMESLGVDEALLPLSIKIGPYVRGRLTLYRAYNAFFNLDLTL